MAQDQDSQYYNHVGTTGDDTINLNETETPKKVNGHAGSDEITTGNGGNNLAAGDMVSNEWQFVDGRWVYNPDAVTNNGYGATRSYDDVIRTGDGDDVLLGNGGNDTLYGGGGDDIINGGRGHDQAFGGSGNDTINLEQGDDFAEAGLGNDTVNAGAGDDVVYGDLRGDNLLAGDTEGLSSFAQYAEGGNWTMTDDQGISTISQSANTEAGRAYTISFELAANLAGGHGAGKVEVLWNGEVVDTVTVTSGVYETHEVTVTGTGEDGALSFRTLPAEDAPRYNFDGPVVSYDKEVDFGDEAVTLKAFAPGQAALYQVIDGDLKVFDVEDREYVDAGVSPGFKINAVGFNVEDDLIYGVAKSSGTDALGNPVKSTDIVAVDATGAAYRVGDGVHGDYVGDFDDEGNLWTFHSSLNRITVVDVDNLDAEGNPALTQYDLPNNLFGDRTYDLAYKADEDCFYAVVSSGQNGADGKVVRIDVSDLQSGGTPSFSEIPITGTLYGDTMKDGMAKGAYGAVFMDGDGNLYYGLNRGDHDLDAGTGAEGGIFKVNMDWTTGQAFSEFMSEAQSTGSNDGAVDPRSADAFATVDADAAVLLRKPELTTVEGGNDALRGGAGRDEIYGNGGDDTIHGGTGEDTISGDSGHDRIYAGADNDQASGGTGNDHVHGQGGNDTLSGGDGDDRVIGGVGDDQLSGDDGNDLMGGGAGSDTLDGGDGNDRIYTGTGNDMAFGGAGDDRMYAQAGHDTLDGGAGNDFLAGSGGNDHLLGGAGNDRMGAGAGHDRMDGGDGNDRLTAGIGDDTAQGGAGNDTFYGQDGNDQLDGGTGNDFMLGGAGHDQMAGGAGTDKLVGGTGADTLEGGAGNDHLWGGNWRGDNAQDVFVVSAGGGRDMIHDFEQNQDQIDLSAYGLDYDEVQSVMTDRGWAVEIDLSGFAGGQVGDKLLIKSINPDDLDESNFIL